MKLWLKACFIVLCFSASLPAVAGRSYSSSSFRSSSGFAARSPSYRSSSTRSAPTYKSFRPAQSNSQTAGTQKASTSSSGYPVYSAATTFSGASSSTTPRQSLLSGRGSQPSPRLQTIIRERESSGPGWMGTAGLVWLLSQHDLSSSDRDWINSRLSEVRSENAIEPAEAVNEQSDVSFYWSYPAHIVNGQSVKISISAVRHGKAMLPVCELGELKSQPDNNIAVITWKPENTVSAVVTCRTEGWVDQRLLNVSPH